MLTCKTLITKLTEKYLGIISIICNDIHGMLMGHTDWLILCPKKKQSERVRSPCHTAGKWTRTPFLLHYTTGYRVFSALVAAL